MIILKNYQKIKQNLPSDSILLYRLGDFYEAFEEDAEKLAKKGFISCKRNGVLMAGILVKKLNDFLEIAGEDVYLIERQESSNYLIKKAIKT